MIYNRNKHMPYQWPVLVRTSYRNTYDGKDIDLEQPTNGSVWLEFVDVWSVDPGREAWLERYGTGRRFEYQRGWTAEQPLCDYDMLVGRPTNRTRLSEIK